MIAIPSAISFKIRPFTMSRLWDAWTRWLNPHYHASLQTLEQLKVRHEEIREFMDSRLL